MRRVLAAAIPGDCRLCRASAADLHGLCEGCYRDVTALPPAQLSLPGVAPWKNSRVAFQYREPLRGLHHALKFRRSVTDGRLLSVLVAERLLSIASETPIEVIVPVPLHCRRLAHRGFNQAALLVAELARQSRLPLQTRRLRRRRHTRAQTGLAAEQRDANLRGAFVASSVAGRNIALFDDVVTTGATARAASRALLEAGAESVCLWAAFVAEPPGTCTAVDDA